MAENNESWLDKALGVVKEIVPAYYNAKTAKEQAQVQNAITESTIAQENSKQASIQTVKNVLLIVGGTLGAILVYKTAIKLLK